MPKSNLFEYIRDFGRSKPVTVGAVAMAIAIMGAMAGCATQNPAARSKADPNEAASFEQAPGRQAALPHEYRMAPGDQLDVLYQVKSWEVQSNFLIAVDHTISVKFPNVPDLNETQMVRPDGKISLPYLGEVSVAGKTVDQLAQELKSRYARIVKEPELYVLVPDFRSAIRDLKSDLRAAPCGVSRLVTVRPDGDATFAIVGDLPVAGKTVSAVKEILNEKYRSVLPGLNVDLFLERTARSQAPMGGEEKRRGASKTAKPACVLGP